MMAAARAPEPTLLLTGFEPFLDRDGKLVDPNPSGDVARALRGRRVAAYRALGVVLPVTYDAVSARIPHLLTEHTPSLVVAMGAGRRGRVAIEQVAANLVTSDRPDNAGRAPTGEPLSPGGPTALRARVDATALAARLASPELSVEASTDAGGYVCNAAYYALLHALDDSALACFVHLPTDIPLARLVRLIEALAATFPPVAPLGSAAPLRQGPRQCPS
jgi:pyroglutamyl-peptidase